MIKNWLLCIAFLSLMGCSQPAKNVDFKGLWIEKSLLEDKGTQSNDLIKSSTPFGLLYFDRNDTDSVRVVYKNGENNIYFSQFAYQSHFVHFDKNKEYFFIPDFETGELVYSNMKDEASCRFVKLDSAYQWTLRDSVINLKEFIPTVK